MASSAVASFALARDSGHRMPTSPHIIGPASRARRPVPGAPSHRVRARQSSIDHSWRRLPGPTPWLAWVVIAATFLGVSTLQLHFSILAAVRITFLLSVVSILGLFTQRSRTLPTGWLSLWYIKAVAIIAGIATIGVAFAIVRSVAFSYLTGVFLRDLASAFCVWVIACHRQWLFVTVRSITAACCTVAGLALIGGVRDSEGRLGGVYMYDPNDLALLCNLTIPLLIWHASDSRSPFRWVGLLLVPLPLYVLMETGSRAALLGLGAMVLALLLMTRLPKGAWIARTVKVAAVALLFATPMLIPEGTMDRIDNVFAGEDYNQTADGGRVQIWRRSIGYIIENPVLGVGLSNFPVADGMNPARLRSLAPGEPMRWASAHNSYLQALSELGLIGGLAFLVLILRSLWEVTRRAKKLRRSRPDDSLLGAALGLCLLGFAVNAIFLSFAYIQIVYVLLALVHGFLIVTAGLPTRASHGRLSVRG